MPRASGLVAVWPVFLCVVSLLCLPSLPAAADCADCDGDGHRWPGDCNDADPATHAGALELCDGRDNDCNGRIDEGNACSDACGEPRVQASPTPVSDVPASYGNTAVVWGDGEFALAWSMVEAVGNNEIYFTRIDADGVRGPLLRITDAPGRSFAPALSWNGSQYGLAWNDERDGNAEIYFARLDRRGRLLAPPVRLTHDSGQSFLPSITWTGADYGIAWMDSRDGNFEIYLARVDAAGSVRQPPLRVTEDSGTSLAPRLVWTGFEFAIAWYDNRDSGDARNFEIFMATLHHGGGRHMRDMRVTPGSLIRVTRDPARSASPALVWSGVEFGLAWQDARSGGSDIYFTVLNPGARRAARDVQVTDNSSQSTLPSLLWTGHEYAVAWQDTELGRRQIQFARVDAGGAIGPPLAIETDPGESFAPSLSWSGTRFGVAWHQEVAFGSVLQAVRFGRVGCPEPVAGRRGRNMPAPRTGTDPRRGASYR